MVNIKRIDYKENLAVALKVFEEIKMDASTLNEELIAINQEQQDILHIIESLNFNASQGFSLAKRLKEIRQERREIKDRIELISNLESTMNLYNVSIKPTLEKSLKKVDTFVKNMPKRKYIIRRLKDLEPLNKLAEKQRGLV